MPSRLPANSTAVSVVPMPSRSGSSADELGDRVVALGGGLGELAQEVVAGLVVVERHEGGDDQLRGHLAGRVSAHAVGEGEQARARVDRVLVVLPYQAPVTASGVAQHQGHGTILHGRGWGNDTRVRMTGVSAAEPGAAAVMTGAR